MADKMVRLLQPGGNAAALDSSINPMIVDLFRNSQNPNPRIASLAAQILQQARNPTGLNYVNLARVTNDYLTQLRVSESQRR